jgi:multiple sugar transport system permease protein
MKRSIGAQRGKSIAINVLAVLIALAFIFPLYYLLVSSLKSVNDLWNDPFLWFFHPTFENFVALFRTRPFGLYYANSLIVVLANVTLSLLLATPAAYGLARCNLRRRDSISFWMLSQLMLPPIAGLVPFYMLIRTMGLLHTRAALIIVYLSFNLPFLTWLLKGFFESLPKDLDEAALVDGCNRFKSFLFIAIPLSLPGIFSTALVSFLLTWNEFLMALALTGSQTLTLPVVITTFWSDRQILWGQICAAGVLIVIPIVLFGLFIQKYLVSGLTMGASKS